MKTNHQRGYKANKPRRVRGHRAENVSQFADKSFSAFSDWEHSQGKKGERRSKSGAKKYVRSRTRFHENAQLRRMVSSE